MQKSPPKLEDWGSLDDLDTQYAFGKLYGKTIDDAVLEFHKSLFERSSELRFVPDIIFNYYIFGLKKFIESDLLEDEDKSDAVSIFLDLIEDKSKSNPESLSLIYFDIKDLINDIAVNQDIYGASQDIYGDFNLLAKNIASKMQKY